MVPDEIRKEKAKIITDFLEKLDTAPDHLEIDESIDVLVKGLQTDEEDICEATTVAAYTDNVLDLPDDKLRLVKYHLRKDNGVKLDIKLNVSISNGIYFICIKSCQILKGCRNLVDIRG